MRKKRNYPEYDLQKKVCRYLDLQYPKAMYMSDTIASVKLTMPQNVRNSAIQKKGFKCPDVIIFEPRGNYHGLFIELKVKSPFKLNGELYADKHLEGQQNTIDDLNEKGYYACFSWGFDMTKKVIDDYMKLPKTKAEKSI